MNIAVKTRPARGLIAVAAALMVLLMASTAVDAGTGKTKRLSVTSSGAERVGIQREPAISASGRFVAFESSAALTGGANGDLQIYVRDRKLRKTKRVSKSTAGAVGTGHSGTPTISANGRLVAFESAANNLIGADGNAARDIFVHNRRSGKTKRVSVHNNGSESTGMSAKPSISADGRFVAFHTDAALVAADTNGTFDVYVRDRRKGKTRRVSVDSAGVQSTEGSTSARISGNGRFVVFGTSAAFVGGDTNGFSDIYVHDRKTKKTKRISNGKGGAEPDDTSVSPFISHSGRFVVFTSSAENLIGDDDNGTHDVFIRDRKQKKTRRVSLSQLGQADGGSFSGPVSANGRYIAFVTSTKLLPVDNNGDFDVYLRDRKQGKTRLLSRDRNGNQANDESRNPAITADGRFVAFDSDASDLIKNDGNLSSDIFVRGPIR